MVCLTQSGVFHVLFASQKPAAEKLRALLADEVLPQLLTHGRYIPGATDTDLLLAKSRSCREERAARLESDAIFLAESGLLAIQGFRVEIGIPARDALSFSRRVYHLAKVYGIQPAKRFIKGAAKNPVNVFPRHILCASANSIIPRLPYTQ